MQVKEVAVLTSPGPKRRNNEDAVLYLDQVPLLAVADGMGGPGVGEAAAAMAMDCLRNNAGFLAAEARKVEENRSSRGRLNLSRLLENSFKWAHMEIGRRAGSRRMASTLITAVIAGDHAYLAHVGNSRAYLLRSGTVRPLTEDHTVAAARRAMGKDAPADPAEQRRLLQILGPGNIDVDLAEVPLADDDVLLLCSDGLNDALDSVFHNDGLLGRALLQRVAQPGQLQAVAQSLIDAASERGVDDNITVALARVSSRATSASIDEVAELMRSIFLFRSLSAAERYILAPYLEERRLARGEVLLREGDYGEEFFVIIEGKVRITRGDVPLVDMGAGYHLGEITLARPGPRSATVAALEPTRLYALSRERFLEVSHRRPAMGARLAMALLDTVGERLRDLTDRIAAAESLVHRVSLPPADARALLAALRGE